MRPSSLWLAPVAVFALVSCYAEVPGSAPADSRDPLDSGAIAGGFGGTLSGGNPGSVGGLGGTQDSGANDPLDGGASNDASMSEQVARPLAPGASA